MNLSLVNTSRTSPPTDIELAAIVRAFHAARVLVIGDVILDRYVTGSVHRLSPEAPIPVLRPADNRCTLGGAANVALNIATLGGQAILVGVIGNDAAGDEVERLVQATPEHRLRPGADRQPADHLQDPLHDGVAPASPA